MKRIVFHIFLLLFVFHCDMCLSQSYTLDLTNPVNEDTIVSMRPTFIWSSSGMSDRTSYSIKLCKVDSLQSSNSAITNNLPILLQGSLLTPSITFPSSLSDLDSNSTYVWQVSMFDSGIPVCISSVNTFHTPFEKETKSIYWFLNHDNKQYVFKDKEINIRYDNKLNSDSIQCQVYNMGASDGAPLFDGFLPLHSGVVLFNLEESTNLNLESNRSYLIVLTTLMGEYFELQFNKL